MSSLSMQRDLIIILRTEIVCNAGILSKLKEMPPDLSRQLFKDNALDKPTQNFFYNLSHYCVCIIDKQAYKSFSWPLYDTKTERAYKTELANFISDYSNKGLLSPVMSSYFVNPSSFRVTKLMFQLSQLAVQRLLTSKLEKESQKILFSEMHDMYKSQQDPDFFERMEQETSFILNKFTNYMHKCKAIEKIAAKLCKKISEMEIKLELSNAQKFLDNLVDSYIDKHSVDESTKLEILDVKNVYKGSQFFESWLLKVDEMIYEVESKWNEKATPFMTICKECQISTKALIERNLGEADRASYMIEYNHKTDEINTKNLQNQVNTDQKYVLTNIVKDEKLNFPNLIRGFIIAILFILENTEIGNEIYKFNKCFELEKKKYSKMVKAVKQLNKKVFNAQERLQSPVRQHRPVSSENFPEIPPLPDFSNLYCTKDLENQSPQTKPLFVTPFNHGPKDHYKKSLISCRSSSCNQLNITNIFHNISVIPHSNQVNKTTTKCTSRPTNNQLLRLLSTKKSSSSKNLAYKSERMSSNTKKRGLFNEAYSSSICEGLFRSYSSPDLCEGKGKPSQARKLSIMPENSPNQLDLSGIAVFDKDSNTTFEGTLIMTHPSSESCDLESNEVNKDFKIDFNKVILEVSNKNPCEEEIKTATPINSRPLIKKTGSLEKIINRFMKVREHVLPKDDENLSEFKTIAEEKENKNANIFTANRNLLPDLLGPSCSGITNKSSNNVDTIYKGVEGKKLRKPRESLGTMLGVDESFLDQFQLID